MKTNKFLFEKPIDAITIEDIKKVNRGPLSIKGQYDDKPFDVDAYRKQLKDQGKI